ncbi:hypothetical protein D1007_11374 [Hordeum vulgare]|nr:hypothetical protein D1007_11374 [Hordeum vulgare]
MGARGDAGGGDEERRRLRAGRGGHRVASGGDAGGGGAGEDARGAGARGPPGDNGAAAGRGRRRPVRLPDAVRHDGGADEGLLRLHGRPLAGAVPRRQAGGRLLRHGHAGRRPGDHGPHGRHAAHAPRHALRARRLHARRRHVRRRRGQGRQPVRGRHLRRRRWQQDAQRRRACLGRAPGEVLRRRRQEAQGRRLKCVGVSTGAKFVYLAITTPYWFLEYILFRMNK